MGRPKNFLRKTVVAFFSGSIKMLPLRVQAMIRDSICPEGVLDYKNKDIRMYVTCDTQIMRLSACNKEPETVQWIETTMKPGDVFYDIGANVGGYSFVAYSHTGGESKIYAFEPSFSTFAELSRNVFLNGAQGRIIPFSVALSGSTKVNEFNFSSMVPGAATHFLGECNDGKYVHKQPVLSFTMDDFIEEFHLDVPNLVKIDVDGSECQVLRGAEKTFQNPKLRSVLIEVDYDQPDAEGIETYMKNKGLVLASRHRRSGAAVNCVFNRE